MIIVYNIVGTFNSGGMERVLTNKANYLTKNGHSVTIITTDQKGRAPFYKLEESIHCIDLGINYTDDLNKNPLIKLFSRIYKTRRHYKILNQKLKQIRADIVISMFDYEAPFLFKINDGSKKVLEIHFSKYKRLQYQRNGIFKIVDNYLSRLDQKIVEKYDKFVVLTEEDKKLWGSLSNLEVIPNANSFVPTSTANLNAKKVIALGRFDYQKGFDDLIKAWSIVYKENSNWILNIYGEGALKRNYQELINELGLGNVVFLKNPILDIEYVYYEHSILAMTSRYEGLPMVLLEAQACGLPLVSYDCMCGPKDIVVDGINGFLVEQGNIDSMSNALLRLMHEEELRKKMGANAKRNSCQFNESLIMKKWITLFTNLMTN